MGFPLFEKEFVITFADVNGNYQRKCNARNMGMR